MCAMRLSVRVPANTLTHHHLQFFDVRKQGGDQPDLGGHDGGSSQMRV